MREMKLPMREVKVGDEVKGHADKEWSVIVDMEVRRSDGFRSCTGRTAKGQFTYIGAMPDELRDVRR